VVGPGSAGDNRAARFDGTTGKLLQNSVVSISDSGDVTGVAALTASGAISCTDLTATGTISGISAADVSAVAKIASATDNRVVRWDGTTGGVVQDSGVTIDDSGNISTAGSVTCVALTATGTITGISTDDVSEGSNLYFTNARADDRIENAAPYFFYGMRSFQGGSQTPGSASTALSGDGVCAGNSLSTDASSSTTAANGMRVFRQLTSAISGNAIFNATNEQVATLDGQPLVHGMFTIDRTTNCRIFFGLGATSASADYAGSDTLDTQAVGVQYSSARADTVWQAVSRDSGGSQTVSAITGATIGTGVFLIRVLANSGSSVTLQVWQNFTLLGSVTRTLTLPTSTTGLFMVFSAETLTGSALTTDTYLNRIDLMRFGAQVVIP